MAGPRPASAVEDPSWRQKLAGRPADEDSNGFFSLSVLFLRRTVPRSRRPSSLRVSSRCCSIPFTMLFTPIVVRYGKAGKRANRAD